MFTTLKSRLLLTYTLIIGALLFSVGLGILLTLRNNPTLFRQQLGQLESSLSMRINQIHGIPDQSLYPNILTSAAIQNGNRFILVNGAGQVLFDTDPAPGARLVFNNPPKESTPGQAQFVQDNRNRSWLFTVKSLDDSRFLIAASLTPRLPLKLMFRDELFKPLLRAGLVAIVTAIALAVLLGNWVEAPLQKLARQAEAVTRGDAQPIPREGPAEVKQLVGTFNTMVSKLNDSQRSQRDFIANISHELKTPLTSIQGFAQAILDQETINPEETKQSAKVIMDEAKRMNKLVLGLLTLARMDAGIADAKKEDVDISFLLRNIFERMSPQAQTAGVSIIERIESDCIGVADAENLNQVFTNLLDNAIKYTGKGGQIIIACHLISDACEIHFIDSGRGIPVEDQERIFERFYQADKSRRGGPKRGVGLGLAIASQYVNSMGGSITLTSQPGKGSDFMVKIPRK